MPEPDPSRILRQHVLTDRLLGVEALPCEVALESQAGLSTPRVQPPPSSRVEARSDPDARQDRYTLQPPPPAGRPTAPPLPPATAADVKLIDGLTTQEKVTRLEALAKAFEADEKVQAMRPPGTNLVFGEGDVDAKLMFIGEGPGEVEDRMGRPFVGPAGELLDKMITAIGLTRESVYIANLVKYRPPGNRVPSPDEAHVQGRYLAQQVAIVRPVALVALGGAATKYALQTTAGITRLRGKWADFTRTDPTLPIMPTFHPAYLLRSYTKDNRMKVWNDLQAVIQRIENR